MSDVERYELMALRSTILSLLDVVQELADEVGHDEWPGVVKKVFNEHRLELALKGEARVGAP